MFNFLEDYISLNLLHGYGKDIPPSSNTLEITALYIALDRLKTTYNKIPYTNVLNHIDLPSQVLNNKWSISITRNESLYFNVTNIDRKTSISIEINKNSCLSNQVHTINLLTQFFIDPIINLLNAIEGIIEEINSKENKYQKELETIFDQEKEYQKIIENYYGFGYQNEIIEAIKVQKEVLESLVLKLKTTVSEDIIFPKIYNSLENKSWKINNQYVSYKQLAEYKLVKIDHHPKKVLENIYAIEKIIETINLNKRERELKAAELLTKQKFYLDEILKYAQYENNYKYDWEYLAIVSINKNIDKVWDIVTNLNYSTKLKHNCKYFNIPKTVEELKIKGINFKNSTIIIQNRNYRSRLILETINWEPKKVYFLLKDIHNLINYLEQASKEEKCS